MNSTSRIIRTTATISSIAITSVTGTSTAIVSSITATGVTTTTATISFTGTTITAIATA